jgi:predicted Zn-dependent protease
MSTFASRVGLRVLPKGYHVIDDPTLVSVDGQPVYSGYRYDDEGVLAQRVELVRDGKLEQLLMSRTPSKDFKTSTGHGRFTFGGVSAAPSTLILRAPRGLSRAALKARLLRELRDEGLEYGFIVRQLSNQFAGAVSMMGGDTGLYTNQGALPNPITLYRVTLDGKEELVRGAAFNGLSTDGLRDILGAGNRLNLYGAGTSPGSGQSFSVAAPDLLIRKIDIQKSTGAHPKPPVMQRPKP